MTPRQAEDAARLIAAMDDFRAATKARTTAENYGRSRFLLVEAQHEAAVRVAHALDLLTIHAKLEADGPVVTKRHAG